MAGAGRGPFSRPRQTAAHWSANPTVCGMASLWETGNRVNSPRRPRPAVETKERIRRSGLSGRPVSLKRRLLAGAHRRPILAHRHPQGDSPCKSEACRPRSRRGRACWWPHGHEVAGRDRRGKARPVLPTPITARRARALQSGRPNGLRQRRHPQGGTAPGSEELEHMRDRQTIFSGLQLATQAGSHHRKNDGPQDHGRGLGLHARPHGHLPDGPRDGRDRRHDQHLSLRPNTWLAPRISAMVP